MLGSDVGLDVTPFGVDGVVNPVHTLVIAGMGIAVVDNADLESLAETAARLNRWEFMFSGAPIPVHGRERVAVERHRDVLTGVARRDARSLVACREGESFELCLAPRAGVRFDRANVGGAESAGHERVLRDASRSVLCGLEEVFYEANRSLSGSAHALQHDDKDPTVSQRQPHPGRCRIGAAPG